MNLAEVLELVGIAERARKVNLEHGGRCYAIRADDRDFATLHHVTEEFALGVGDLLERLGIHTGVAVIVKPGCQCREGFPVIFIRHGSRSGRLGAK